MTTIKKWVFLIGGLLVTAIVITRLRSITLSEDFINRHGDAMDWQSSWLAGRQSVNCGRVRIGQDPGPATKCGLAAFALGRPFRVRYDIKGWDSPVAGGLVRTTDGRLHALSFIGDSNGGGRTSLWGQRVNVQSCPEPARLYVNPKGRLNCFQAEQSPPADISSPNMEPY